MDRLQAMTAFLAVVDAGGFSPAARKLNISPSVVTRAVAELEVRLGARLLVRTTRTVRTTEVGAAFADNCRRILADIEDSELAATGTHAAPTGRLTITAPVNFGRMHVLPVVHHYLSQYPDVDIHCWFVDRNVNLIDEGVDVAIRIGHLPDSSLQALKIGAVRRVICAAPDYLSRHAAPQRPDDLMDHVTIVTTASTPTPDWRFRVDDKATVVHLRPRLTTTTNDAAKHAAIAGLGIVRLPLYHVSQEVKTGALQILLEPFEQAPLPIHVVHREGRHATKKVRGFIDTAVDILRGRGKAGSF